MQTQAEIIILDDDVRRTSRMRVVMDEAEISLDTKFFNNAWDCGAYLLDHDRAVAIVSLDHDLDKAKLPGGIDPGDGRDVARVFAKLASKPAVIIHSSNAPMAERMRFMLEESGVEVVLCGAWTDLSIAGDEAEIAWIRRDWIAQLKKLIAAERPLDSQK